MSNSRTRRAAAAARQERIEAKEASVVRPAEGRPRFVADVMLGRLAKWLRIAGFDAAYSNTFSDDALLEISNREGRVLLSRDTRLLIRDPAREFLFIRSPDLEAQLGQVFDALRIESLDAVLTRCLSCNEALVEAPRESVRGRVPDFVYRTQPCFRVCPGCRKIFWAGTHREAVVRKLETLLP